MKRAWRVLQISMISLRDARALARLRLRFFCGVRLREQTLLSHGLRVVPLVTDAAVDAVGDMLAETAFGARSRSTSARSAAFSSSAACFRATRHAARRSETAPDMTTTTARGRTEVAVAAAAWVGSPTQARLCALPRQRRYIE